MNLAARKPCKFLRASAPRWKTLQSYLSVCKLCNFFLRACGARGNVAMNLPVRKSCKFFRVPRRARKRCNLSVHKPGLNYIFKFNNDNVPEISSNYFNLYGQFKNLKGNGFNNTEIATHEANSTILSRKYLFCY